MRAATLQQCTSVNFAHATFTCTFTKFTGTFSTFTPKFTDTARPQPNGPPRVAALCDHRSEHGEHGERHCGTPGRAALVGGRS